MSDHFELLDVYKAVISMIAGLILGFEREMKDKSAGLKTITIICLGSTLFSIISYKLAGEGDPTRIASYIVSGIGFLGAGVIFKEGFSGYGLTTAGVIWIAAAVGMAIGFGEVNMAFVFLIASLVVINSSTFIMKYLMPLHLSKILKLEIANGNAQKKAVIIEEIKKTVNRVSEVSLENSQHRMLLTMELRITEKQIDALETFLLSNEDITYFSL